MNLLDPTQVQDLGDPSQWAAMSGLPADMGSLFLTNPNKAIEKLAAAGVPPPTSGAAAMPASFDDRFVGGPADVPVPQSFDPFKTGQGPGPRPNLGAIPKVQAQVPQPQGQQLYQYPIGPDLDPMTVGAAVPQGDPNAPLALDPNSSGRPRPGGAIANPPSSAAGTFGPRQPSDMASMLQGLKALSPPPVHYQPATSPPMPRVEGPEGVKNQLDTAGMMRLFQQLAQPGTGPLLSQLLRTHA